MNKKIIFIIAVAVILVGASIWGLMNYQNQQQVVITSDKVMIVTTLFPLYDMAKNIGGDKVEVLQLLPPGVEPHSYEPKPSDIVKINEADIFVYTGKYMETWAEDIIKGVINKDLKIVDSSDGVQLATGAKEEEHGEEEHGEEEHGEEHSHNHNGVDPHIWLDFDKAQIMADNIAKALIVKDASNAEFYQNNVNEYKNKLMAMDNNYRKTLDDCQSRVIVYGGHYAFGYLSNRYGLQYLAAQGVSPDAEPTASDLAALVDQIKKNNIKYIFFEELASPKIAVTIANETSARLLLLNAAHNLTKDQFDSGVSFVDILNDNLNNLKIGLTCR